VSTLFVVLQSSADPPATAALRKAADALVPEIAKLGPPWVGSVEDGVQEAMSFAKPRAGLYADLPKLRALRDDVVARYDWEVAKAADQLLDESNPPPEITEKTLEERFGVSAKDKERYPDGFYQSTDGKALIVAIRSKVLGSDFKDGTEAIRRVREVVDRV